MGMIGFHGRRAGMAALFAVPLVAVAARAQAVTLAGGARTYGEGSMPMVALRTEFPLPGPLLLELAGSVADAQDDAERSATSLLEAQVQLEVPLGAVITSYAGGGVGAARTAVRGVDEDGAEIVYSLGVGARVALSEQLGIVVDARLRDFGSASGDEHTDVSVGLRYQFRPTDRPRFRGAR